MTSKAVWQDWKARGVLDRVRQGVARGLTHAAVDAIAVAKPAAPYQYGKLRGSIRHNQPRIDGDRVSLLWGSHDVHYAKYQEYGTKYMRGKFFLRKGADTVSGNLDRYIQNEVKRMLE